MLIKGLPTFIHYEGFMYILSDEPLKKGDWYVDHQKYCYKMNPIEDCDSDSLADFINERRSGWRSKKIEQTNDPVLNYYGVKSIL